MLPKKSLKSVVDVGLNYAMKSSIVPPPAKGALAVGKL